MAETTSHPPARPRRRWLRISLRGMLVTMLLACCWLGWVTRQAKLQREAVAWVEAHGGNVAYEYELTSIGPDGAVTSPQAEPQTWKWIPLPNAWKAWLGRDFEWRVVTVDLLPDGTEFKAVWSYLPQSGVAKLVTVHFFDRG